MELFPDAYGRCLNWSLLISMIPYLRVFPLLLTAVSIPQNVALHSSLQFLELSKNASIPVNYQGLFPDFSSNLTELLYLNLVTPVYPETADKVSLVGVFPDVRVIKSKSIECNVIPSNLCRLAQVPLVNYFFPAPLKSWRSQKTCNAGELPVCTDELLALATAAWAINETANPMDFQTAVDAAIAQATSDIDAESARVTALSPEKLEEETIAKAKALDDARYEALTSYQKKLEDCGEDAVCLAEVEAEEVARLLAEAIAACDSDAYCIVKVECAKDSMCLSKAACVNDNEDSAAQTLCIGILDCDDSDDNVTCLKLVDCGDDQECRRLVGMTPSEIAAEEAEAARIAALTPEELAAEAIGKCEDDACLAAFGKEAAAACADEEPSLQPECYEASIALCAGNDVCLNAQNVQALSQTSAARSSFTTPGILTVFILALAVI
jgi:hypothetical protein